MKRLLLASVAMAAMSAPSFAQGISFDGLRTDLGNGPIADRPGEAFPGGSMESAGGAGPGAFTVSGITFEHLRAGAGGGFPGQAARPGGGTAGAVFDDTFVLARRAGYLVSPKLMPYGSIGWEVSRPDSGFLPATRDDWHNGVRFGAGAEYAFTASVFARAEFDYTRFAAEGNGMAPDRTQVLLGVSYRFR